MSDRDRTTDHRDCGGDVAAFALGALDATEADAFRRHLDTCSVCQEELTAFQQVVNELPLATAPHKAPASIRRKVLREVHADARATRRSSSADRSVQFRGAWWTVRRSALAQAAAVVVAVGIVAAVIASHGSGPHARVYTGLVTGAGSAQLQVAPGRASLVVHHFAQPPAGKIYEVWLVRGSKSPSPTTADWSPTSAGNATVEVPGNLKGVSTVLVTPEPMGGSPHPTHAPVISVPLD